MSASPEPREPSVNRQAMTLSRSQVSPPCYKAPPAMRLRPARRGDRPAWRPGRRLRGELGLAACRGRYAKARRIAHARRHHESEALLTKQASGQGKRSAAGRMRQLVLLTVARNKERQSAPRCCLLSNTCATQRHLSRDVRVGEELMIFRARFPERGQSQWPLPNPRPSLLLQATNMNTPE